MDADGKQRIDKWLFAARIVRTRSLAAELVAGGQVRLNRGKIAKPAHPVATGDILTLALNGRVRVLKVTACAPRRGPASSARLLYEELAMTGTDGSMPQKGDATENGTC